MEIHLGRLAFYLRSIFRLGQIGEYFYLFHRRTWSGRCLPTPRPGAWTSTRHSPAVLEEETRGRPQPGRCGLKAPSPTHLGAGREGMLRSSRAGEEHGEETGQGGWGRVFRWMDQSEQRRRESLVCPRSRQEAMGGSQGLFQGPPCPQRARHAWWASRARPRLDLLFARSSLQRHS